MSSTHANPPRPTFALGIGIVGHRLNRLPEAGRDKVAAEVAQVLVAISDCARSAKRRHEAMFAGGAPVLTLVSALAEGADRIAAEAALTRGYLLDAPLPFAPTLYELDFGSPESVAQFRSLLAKARSVLALPGRREAVEQAYDDVGKAVLAQSDILIGVWDGGPSAGRAGTTELLSEAANLGLPIIHVDAAGQRPTRLLWNDTGVVAAPSELLGLLTGQSMDGVLPGLLDRLVQPPLDPYERRALDRFLGERVVPFNWRIEFPLLMAILRVRPLRRSDVVPPHPMQYAEDYAALQEMGTQGAVSPLAPLPQGYGWSDRVAGMLGQAFRGAFIANFVLAALSVVAAAASLVAHDPSELADIAHHKLPFVITELILIALVLANTTLGRRANWHARWVEARELAERFRATLPLWTLGLRPISFAGQELAWTGWYCRAVLRAEGLRPGTLDGIGLERARAQLLHILRDQSAYNRANAKRMEGLDHRLERVGEIFFGTTLLTALGFVIAVFCGIPVSPRIAFIITALTAALPALATATYGIRLIGDFEGVAARAERTHHLLARVLDSIDQDDPTDFVVLKARARAAADALLSDVASWRLAAESRGLSVPG